MLLVSSVLGISNFEPCFRSEREAREQVKSLRYQYAPAVDKLRNRDQFLQELHPALWKTIRWMEDGGMSRLTPGSISKLPVLALRWSHDKVSSNACFYDGSSIYFAVDELMRAPLPTNQGPPLSQTTIPPCVDGACLLELHKGNRSKVVMVPKTMTVKELAMQYGTLVVCLQTHPDMREVLLAASWEPQHH